MDNPKWEYRTVQGLAKEAAIPKEKIKQVLNNSPKVLVSVNKYKNQQLYTLKKNKSILGDYWTKFKLFNSYKIGL
jgi:hypothetical protein